LIVPPARHHPAQDTLEREQQFGIGGGGIRVKENFGRRGAKLPKGDADRAGGKLGLDDGSRDVCIDVLGGLFAEGGFEFRREEVGDGLERDRDGIFGGNRRG
jgi:hypothetical protein